MRPGISQRRARLRGRRFRSIKSKITLLLLVSLVSLTTLWAFAASIALGDGLNLRNVNTVQSHFGYPAGALGSALQVERRLSVVYLGSKTAGDRAAMESVRLVTDRQVELFRTLATDEQVQDAAPDQAKQVANDIISWSNTLSAKRAAIDSGATGRAQVFVHYSAILGTISTLQGSLSTLSNPDVAKDARNQLALARARETLSQEDALLAGTLAAGRMTAAEHAEFVKLVGTQHSLYDLVVPELRSGDQAYYRRITATPEYNRLRSLEERVIRSRRGVRAGDGTDMLWKATADVNLTRLRGLELSATAAANQRAKPVADRIILRLVIAGALGLVAVLASLLLALWVARSVIHELLRLKREALDLADVRLPGVIQRLRRGEQVDVEAEAPPLSFATAEIDQVGQAFNAARRTAIQGAVEEAALREGVNEVFVNLARRSQSLLHRQLNLLDTMERRNSEPDELDDLFRLDHLATRMRRHAEGLIILSGQAPGRGWRNPVAIVDITRAAAAEVEDYTRVTVAPMPQTSVTGRAVADVIHLLAELIENATMFSPKNTTVQVTGQVAAHGFSLEIEDRGLSMDEESLALANRRLAEPPEFDLPNSAQLGLFVVGRLAQRHRIKVTLRTSPFGGMTAIVLLPEDIVVQDGVNDVHTGSSALTHRTEEAPVPTGNVPNDWRKGGTQASGAGAGGPVLRLHSSESAGKPAGDRPRGLPSRRATDSTDSTDSTVTPWPGMVRSHVQSVQEIRRHEWHGDPSTSAESDVDAAGPAPQPFERPRSVTQPFEQPRLVPPAADSAPRPSRRSGSSRRPAKVDGRPPLPQRVRQAHLAPQLYEDSASAPPSRSDVRSERSPEELRAMLSSIQKGTLRGRSEPIGNDDAES